MLLLCTRAVFFILNTVDHANNSKSGLVKNHYINHIFYLLEVLLIDQDMLLFATSWHALVKFLAGFCYLKKGLLKKH